MDKEGNRLMELRGNHSRKAIADKLEITPQMLGAIERGDRTPSLALAKKISDLYEVTIDDIFFTQIRNEMCLEDRNDEVG